MSRTHRPGHPVVRVTLIGVAAVLLAGAVSAPATAAAPEVGSVVAPTTANWGWE